jgi:hypothetical protein
MIVVNCRCCPISLRVLPNLSPWGQHNLGNLPNKSRAFHSVKPHVAPPLAVLSQLRNCLAYLTAPSRAWQRWTEAFGMNQTLLALITEARARDYGKMDSVAFRNGTSCSQTEHMVMLMSTKRPTLGVDNTSNTRTSTAQLADLDCRGFHVALNQQDYGQ